MGDPRSTLVIVEGVLMYLEAAQVALLLRDQIRALSPVPVRLVFSHMVRWEDGRSGFRPSSALIDRWLAWRSEPFKWAIPAQAIAGWLRAQGFSVLARAEPPFPVEGFAGGDCALKGENLVLCQSVTLAAGA